MTANPSAPSDVAILTVSYNSSAQLESFLAGAYVSVSDPAHVFVIDNASADLSNTQQICSDFGVTLLPLKSNLGYGGAINRGADLLPPQVKYLVVSNPDVEINPEAVVELRSALTETSHIGTIGPKILNADGSSYPSAREIPSISSGIGHALFANIWPSNPWTKKYHSQAYLSEKAIETGWVSGACLGIRRDLFDTVNGFDENYFMYFEDVDLGYRLKKLGYKNVFLPTAQVTHIGGESTKTVKGQMLRIHHESALRFIRIRYSGFWWAPLRLIVKLGLSLRLKFQLRQAA